MLASFLKSNLLRTDLCENVKGRLVTSNQRLYGNAQYIPGPQIWKPEEEELVVCAPFTNRTIVAGGFPFQLVLRKIFA